MGRKSHARVKTRQAAPTVRRPLAPGPAARAVQLIAAGLDHHQAGRLEQAEPLYQQALSFDPASSDAVHLLGVLANQRGDAGRAVELIERAIRLDQRVAGYHNNLGNVLKDLGRLDEAAASYRRALELEPTLAEAFDNLGAALRDLGQVEPALAAGQRALQLAPERPSFLSNLAATLRAMGRLTDALALAERAVALDPSEVGAWLNLGNALWELTRLDDAAAAYRRAIELRPDLAEARSNLGNVLRDLGRLDEAVASYADAIRLKPTWPAGYSNLGAALIAQGRPAEAAVAFRRALDLQPDYVDAHDNLLLSLLYLPELGQAELVEAYRAWDRQHGQVPAGGLRPHGNQPDPERRLRIGYVSPDFRQHAIAYAVLPLLERHDRAQFEVICYSSTRQPDQMTARLRGVADGWREIVGLSDQAAAEQIRADGVDILVDLACHTAGNRLRIFTRKPAPIQVTHSGMISGLGAMDYVLCDELLAPELAPDGDAERPMRLPRCYTAYGPPAEAPAVVPLPALAAGRATFGSFNNLTKLSAPTVELWARVLRAVPDSRLVLKGSQAVDAATHQRLLAAFEAAGVERERVEFRAKTRGLAEHLALYGEIDLALDPFPFNGYTTTCEALWMGVPVVTLAGRFFADRAGVTFLTAAGLPELIANDAAGYVERARALASDLPGLAALRSNLRGLVAASPLCDGPGYARAVETAFRAAWHRWCAEQAG